VATWVQHLAGALTHQLVNPAASLPPAVEQACRLVRAHAAEELNVERVAKAVGLSTGHLSRQFHHATGLRLVEYIARVRVEQATELLAEGHRSITAIAFACGFHTLSQFNRTFRRLTGRSPREWRSADRPMRSPAGQAPAVSLARARSMMARKAEKSSSRVPLSM
jgi:transcriptional regulator GlxA family with amidase domain